MKLSHWSSNLTVFAYWLSYFVVVSREAFLFLVVVQLVFHCESALSIALLVLQIPGRCFQSYAFNWLARVVRLE